MILPVGQVPLCSGASISRTRCNEAISIGHSGGARLASLRMFRFAGIRNRHGQPVTRYILHKHALSRPTPSTPLPPASARAASVGRSGDDQPVARSRESRHDRPVLGGRPQSQAHRRAAGSTGATAKNAPIGQMCCAAKAFPPNSTYRLERQLSGGSTPAGVRCLCTAHGVMSSEPRS